VSDAMVGQHRAGEDPPAVDIPWRRYLIVTAIVLSGFLLKIALMDMEAVSFDSDEAVVALMAKHIVAGERPVFFYGQTYMGSLDAFLIAASFRLLGTSVFAVRIVQAFLFVGLMLVTYLLARRLSEDETTAQVAALLTALPTALMSLYTTVTLGGYGEMLLFGVWLLLLGHQVTHEAEDSWPVWALMGFVGGLAFWTQPLSVVYLVPVALAILRRWRWRLGGRYALALLAIVIGCSPWWGYCLGHPQTCFQLLKEPPPGLVASPGWLQAVGQRVFGFLFLGLPALWGLRYPWSAKLILFPLVVPVLALYIGNIVYALLVRNRSRFLPLAMGATFMILFLGTPLGNDATGRYLLPLYLLVVFLAAELIHALKVRSRWLAIAALGCVLAVNLWGTLRGTAAGPAGMTAQLDARLQFGNKHDAALIDFLEERQEYRGYSNYWVAFKINFLSDEEIILAPRLPYKMDLSYAPVDDRYPAYSVQVDQSPEPPFYVTSNQPDLDEKLRQALNARQIGYQESAIGAYHVFYDLSAAVSPEGLALHSAP
jgi:4-amino-4-deoxy-L-arabinose transferase-like glycosyltransferase